MDGKLKLPNLEERAKEVALSNMWCRRRYLSSGIEGNNFALELIGYTDDLLEQLGFSTHRRGWFGDLFVPSTPKNLAGLAEEYKKKYGYDETVGSETQRCKS